MDREIPKEVRDKERKKKFIKYGAIGVAAVVCIAVLISFMRSSVNKKDLVFSEVDNGTIEVSVSASGKVVPAFEEIINSPINTRIVEVYRKGGDSVDVGTPILKLDLQSTETEYKKLLDEEQMKRYQLEQLKVNNNTYLSDLSMQVKISAMKLNRMEVELRNERYLDSLGSGTTDKVRQAELNFNTGKLELEQLRQQYANESKVKEADLKVKELEFNIFSKSLAEMKRTLDDAQIRSPRKAILTYINNQVGAQVAEGSQVAIISDLSHFKVEGEIADTYGDRVAAGGRAIVKIGNEKLEGTVSSVTPLSKNGVISFIVQLNEDNNKRLRSGLKTDVYVMNAVKEGVLRLANASYYVGRGEYELFVQDSKDEVVKRKVQLGDSNFEYVEVISGLKPGDKVVVSDMSSYKNKNKLEVEIRSSYDINNKIKLSLN
ncbi:HlyD family efflux transporter periplasmic adaptor subunit [Phocaeicola dorei]|nr:HlyD family efflux transporter periplasmic adaptor subunit [Phocaeicola dorei]